MKLLVEHRDGNKELLTLVPPVELKLGDNLNVLKSSNGMEHFFYADDGKYDGWGMACEIPFDPSQLGQPNPAEELIDRIESSREKQAGPEVDE